MNCSKECRFCAIRDGKYKLGKIDTPIVSNNNYFLLSSVGAMIEGWSLVIPKEHSCSIRSYYTNDSFKDFLNNTLKIMKRHYPNKKIFVFEHGANNFGSLTSCGTNHSHLHIIPSEFYILEDIKKMLSFDEVNYNDIEKYVKDSEYLMYCEIDDGFNYDDAKCYVHLLEEPVSQFFRKVIANKLGIPEKYDYKVNMNLDIAEKTYYTLREVCNE